MDKKRTLVPIFLLLALPLVSAQEFDLPNLVKDIFGDKGLWGLIQSPQVVFGITFILLFMLFYAIFAAALRMVTIFKDGDNLSKNGKIVALAFSGLTNFSIFFFKGNKGMEEILVDVLGSFGIFGGLVLGLVVFLIIFMGFRDMDIGGRSLVGLVAAGLAMILVGALLTMPNVMGIGWLMALIPGIFMLISAWGGGQQQQAITPPGPGPGPFTPPGPGPGPIPPGPGPNPPPGPVPPPGPGQHIRTLLRGMQQWPDLNGIRTGSVGSFTYGFLLDQGNNHVRLHQVQANIIILGRAINQLINEMNQDPQLQQTLMTQHFPTIVNTYNNALQQFGQFFDIPQLNTYTNQFANYINGLPQQQQQQFPLINGANVEQLLTLANPQAAQLYGFFNNLRGPYCTNIDSFIQTETLLRALR